MLRKLNFDAHIETFTVRRRHGREGKEDKMRDIGRERGGRGREGWRRGKEMVGNKAGQN